MDFPIVIESIDNRATVRLDGYSDGDIGWLAPSGSVYTRPAREHLNVFDIPRAMVVDAEADIRQLITEKTPAGMRPHIGIVWTAPGGVPVSYGAMYVTVPVVPAGNEAVQRADGEHIHDEYTWINFTSWDDVEEWHEDDDEPVEYERVRFTVEVLERRTVNAHPVCDDYDGEEQARSWVAVFVTSDGTGDTWPANGDFSIGQNFDTQDLADEWVAGLPDVIHVVPMYGGGPYEITRDRLRTEVQGYSQWPACSTCGRSKIAHQRRDGDQT